MLVLAIVCTVLCCIVLAILAKQHNDDADGAGCDLLAKNGELSNPFKIALGVLAAIMMIFLIVIILNVSLQRSEDTDDGSVSLVITTSSGAFAVGDVLQGQSTFTITTTSALAFAPGDIISGASSSSTATVVSAPDSTTLEVRSVNAPFTANEVISSTTTTAKGTYVSTTTPAAATIKKVDGSTGLSVVPSAGSFSANEVISAPTGSNAVGVYKSSDADTSDSDSRNYRTWVVILLVLAIVCTVLCCCVLAILAKRDDDSKDMAALPTPFKIGLGVLAAIISIFLIVVIITLLQRSADTDDGSVSFVITTSSGAFAVGDVLQGQSTFTITTTSALAFAPGDIISGASSSSTATVVSAPDSTTLEVRSVNAPFTANEVISSTTTTAKGTYVSTTTPAAATIKKVDGSTGLSVVPSAGSFSANEVISAPTGSNAVGVYKSSDADTSDSDSRNYRTWVVILLVLAIVCTVLCCCVLAILAKRDDDSKDMAALPTPFKIGLGVLAAIIIILLVAIICPIKEWNSGSTAISATNKHSYKVGLFETNLKDERTVCCDANGNSYDTTDSDVTSNNYGKTKDAGEVAFSLLVGAIMLIFVAAVLAVFLFSPTMMIAAIVSTAVAFILETAAWANWADKVGDNDTDYGACFIIAV